MKTEIKFERNDEGGWTAFIGKATLGTLIASNETDGSIKWNFSPKGGRGKLLALPVFRAWRDFRGEQINAEIMAATKEIAEAQERLAEAQARFASLHKEGGNLAEAVGLAFVVSG